MKARAAFISSKKHKHVMMLSTALEMPIGGTDHLKKQLYIGSAIPPYESK